MLQIERSERSRTAILEAALDLYSQSQALATSVTVNGLPTGYTTYTVTSNTAPPPTLRR